MTDRYESRASTHAADCWDWGARHYGCAVREIERLRARVATVKAERDALRAESAELRERVKELEADAARYRWLRSKGFGFSHDEAGRGISAGRWGEWHMDSAEGFAAQADAAIDAAMQEGE